ncbi:MAG TPA: type II toxin-antitoxin system RelE/ParE family toxin [Bryobacteraceae bacterium]|nr:type II toxin-antitoxin system RelE/ParE family toxin [Bryobacteraceae bacterium]
MTIRWTQTALRDLESLHAHAAEDNFPAAADTVERILSGIEAISRHPEIGRKGRVTGTRELIVSPYIVAYRIEGNRGTGRHHSLGPEMAGFVLSLLALRLLLIPDRLQRWSAWRAKGPNITHRWLAEETAVFAVKLAGTFVSDLKGRAGGVQTIHEHATVAQPPEIPWNRASPSKSN